MRRNTDGFTIIELLIVIAIIAILAALLFPVFAQARAKARQSVCMSNEKQLTYAILLYNNDYDERWIDYFPNYSEKDPVKGLYGGDDGNAPGTDNPPYLGPRWIVPRVNAYTKDYLLKPYVHNDGIQYCPSLHKGTDDLGDTILLPNYALNELNSGAVSFPGHIPPDYNKDTGQWPYTGPFGRANVLLTHPATLMILWEHNRPENLCNTWSTSPAHWNTPHHEGFNAAFADGHVKRFSVGQLTNQLMVYWDL